MVGFGVQSCGSLVGVLGDCVNGGETWACVGRRGYLYAEAYAGRMCDGDDSWAVSCRWLVALVKV